MPIAPLLPEETSIVYHLSVYHLSQILSRLELHDKLFPRGQREVLQGGAAVFHLLRRHTRCHRGCHAGRGWTICQGGRRIGKNASQHEQTGYRNQGCWSEQCSSLHHHGSPFRKDKVTLETRLADLALRNGLFASGRVGERTLGEFYPPRKRKIRPRYFYVSVHDCDGLATGRCLIRCRTWPFGSWKDPVWPPIRPRKRLGMWFLPAWKIAP